MPSQAKEVFEFGKFRLNATDRVLFHGELVVRLMPKAVETLLILIQHQGQVVSKEKLLRTLWPDVIVEENNLSQHISTLRKTLGEDGQGNGYIETIPKRGYRFAAEVTVASNTAGLQPSSKHSLAVLPFKLHGFAETETYLGIGSTDALITSLSRIKALTLRPLSGVVPFQHMAVDRIEAGRALGVDFLLDGSLQHVGGEVRANLQLLNVSSGETLWSAILDGKLSNVFALQDAIAQQVARVLLPKLTQSEQQMLEKPLTQNLKAYELYLTGRHHWANQTVESMRLALKYYEQALALDANFALAHCGIADHYTWLSWDGHISPHEAMPRAKTAALNALMLDETLPQAHLSLGLTQMTYDFNWYAAEQSFERALELNEADEMGYFWAVTLRVALSRFEEVPALVAQGIRTNPLSLTMYSLSGIAHYYARRYDEAEAACQAALALIPNHPMACFMLGLIHMAQGKHAQAIAGLEQAVTGSGRMIRVLSALGCAYARAGTLSAAQAVLAELAARAETKYVPSCYFAVIYAALEQPEQTFAWLQKAYEDRNGFLMYANVEPVFDPLRQDPRFAALLQRLGLAAAT